MSQYESQFRRAYTQMQARRSGAQPTYLHVSFLRNGEVVTARVLEERYACKRMGDWAAKGPEYGTRNYLLPAQ